MNNYVIISNKDNVAVALTDLKKGQDIKIMGSTLILVEDIPLGHKFAIKQINEKDSVIKYGSPIGIALTNISPGEHVHIHNIKTNLNINEKYTYKPEPASTYCNNIDMPSYFYGYNRKNGCVGVRNEIWIIPTVGCVNKVAQKIESLARQRFSNIKGIDGIFAFTHPYGCSQLGDDQNNTRKILADLCSHPNAGGILLLGLGCENSGIEEVKKYIKDLDSLSIKCLVSQDSDDEITDSLLLVEELISKASKYHRTKVPVSELTIGVKCGGSDGLSGVTANPTVGCFSDAIVSFGGNVIMSEVPEMFGAEQLLMNRCESREVFDSTVEMITQYKKYFISHHQPIYENPSPGNKKGGISTLEDKSLGCTQKSGSSTVRDVLKYGETIKAHGLSLLSAPGNDLVASTALAASGAQIILFTTGRGTPFAAPVPTIKISSNSILSRRKPKWIDFDAGKVVGSISIHDASMELYKLVIDVANGKYVKSEIAGYHDMAIFKQGITL